MKLERFVPTEDDLRPKLRVAMMNKGIVQNICLFSEESTLPPDTIDVTDMPAVDIGWTYNGTTFNPPIIDLSHIKTIKFSQIETDRDNQRYSDVEAHGRIWDADKDSQELLGQAITMAGAGLPLPAEWKDASNSKMPITSLSQLLAIAGAIVAQTEAAYTRSWARKEALIAATTIEEINAV